MHVMSIQQATPKTYGSAGLFLVPRREQVRLALVARAPEAVTGLVKRRRVLFAVVAAPLALACLLLMGQA